MFLEIQVERYRDMVRVYNTTKNSCLGEQIGMADSSLRRLVGLLGKRSLAPGEGCSLCLRRRFTLLGWRFPIDVVFVDKKYSVLGVREAVRPFPRYPCVLEGFGVLELPAGTISESRTEVGDQLKSISQLPLRSSARSPVVRRDGRRARDRLPLAPLRKGFNRR